MTNINGHTKSSNFSKLTLYINEKNKVLEKLRASLRIARKFWLKTKFRK